MKFHKWILISALAMLVAAGATAQLPMGRHGHGAAVWDDLAADFDQNQDGQITRDELGAANTFDRFDRNADGVLTAEDFSRTRGQRGAKMGRGGPGPGGAMARGGGMGRGGMAGGFLIRAADSDGDRAITAAELDAFLTELDADGDGTLTGDELAATFGGRGAGRATTVEVEVEDVRQAFADLDADADGEVSGDELPSFGRRRGPRGGGGMILRHADVDENGEISSAEWQGFVGQIDGDGDGVITAAEWTAALPGPPDREPPAELFDRLSRTFDRDGDGVLETADLDTLFSELDADASGVIEADERRGRRGRRHGRG